MLNTIFKKALFFSIIAHAIVLFFPKDFHLNFDLFLDKKTKEKIKPVKEAIQNAEWKMKVVEVEKRRIDERIKDLEESFPFLKEVLPKSESTLNIMEQREKQKNAFIHKEKKDLEKLSDYAKKYLQAMKKYKGILDKQRDKIVHDEYFKDNYSEILQKSKDTHNTEQRIKIRLTEKSRGFKFSEKPTEKQVKNECKNGFNGIGVEFSGNSQNLINVVEGYPAHQAGLRKGDVVLSIEELDGPKRIKLGLISARGPRGSKILINYSRNGKIKQTTLTRDSVCANKILN